jgi:2-methylcitrate dehydratase
VSRAFTSAAERKAIADVIATLDERPMTDLTALLAGVLVPGAGV